MSLTRRQFLLSVPAVAAGFVLPSFLTRATEYLERSGSPLLVPPERHSCVITANSELAGEGYQLCIGNPFEEPPAFTLREYLDTYYCGEEEDYMEDFGLDKRQFLKALDKPADWDLYADDWLRQDSPQRIAYDYLHGLDLGSELESEHAVGSIQFIDGDRPGSDYIAAHATDDISLSLLQDRLNRLGEGVKIELG